MTQSKFFTCGQLARRWNCSIVEVMNLARDTANKLTPTYLSDLQGRTEDLLAFETSVVERFESLYFTEQELHPTNCIIVDGLEMGTEEVDPNSLESEFGVRKIGSGYRVQLSLRNWCHIKRELTELRNSVKTPSSQEKDRRFAHEEIRQDLSRMAISNLYTMGITCQNDPRQSIPDSAGMPNLETRRLRAKLILEEAFETVEALGFVVTGRVGKSESVLDPKRLHLVELSTGPNMEDAIDGCIDTMYVCVGTLMAMGVPDLPFANEVCRANEDKFPNGESVVNDAGKFLKPEGWNPPDILGVLNHHGNAGLNELSKRIIRDYNGNICGEEATE